MDSIDVAARRCLREAAGAAAGRRAACGGRIALLASTCTDTPTRTPYIRGTRYIHIQLTTYDGTYESTDGLTLTYLLLQRSFPPNHRLPRRHTTQDTGRSFCARIGAETPWFSLLLILVGKYSYVDSIDFTDPLSTGTKGTYPTGTGTCTGSRRRTW